MRTTLNIDDDLYRKIKSKAALEGRKVTDLIHQGLLHVLHESKSKADLKINSEHFPYKPIDRSNGKKLFEHLSTEEYIEKLKKIDSNEK